MKTEAEIYCHSFKYINDIIACTSDDEVISREDSYKIKTLLEKCYLEVLEKIDKGYIKDESEAAFIKSIFQREYYALHFDSYKIELDRDYYYPLYTILHDWDDACDVCGVKYGRVFCEHFLNDYKLFHPVHI